MSPPGDTAQPVFIVGCARSGTTLLYEALARHPEAAWFSTWTNRTGRSDLAAFNWLFKRGWHSNRRGPRPDEGYRLWDAILALPDTLTHASLGAEHATPEVAGRLARTIEGHRRFGRGSVFVNKTTRNSRRVPFLQAIYPDARFIHVVRSPLDTVSSLLAMPWLRSLPFWERDASSGEASGTPVDEARRAALLWVSETSAAREAGGRLRAHQYREVRYEELVGSAPEVVGEVLAWLDLPRPGGDAARLLPDVFAASVGAYESRLDPEQVRAVGAAARELASDLGYSL